MPPKGGDAFACYEQKHPSLERQPRPCHGSDRSETWTLDCLTSAPSLGSEGPLGDVPVGSGGHSFLHESSTLVPGTGVVDLRPEGLE